MDNDYGIEEPRTKGRSSSPTDQPYEVLRKNTRKRANTTSSGNGENKRTANKVCRVCGDKAFSYNFNVITCESCKAFFRRNANKEKEIRCPFNEKCEINIVSRRFCQRCRLAKCFNVGMKKEWIMSDEARLEKKQRVEENRERRLLDALNRVNDDYIDNEQGVDDVQQQTTGYDYCMDEGQKCHSSGSGVGNNQQDNQNHVMMQHDDQKIGYPNCSYSSHEYEFSPMNPNSSGYQPHSSMELPTTGAASSAEVCSTTNSISSMNVDPSRTMTSNGFLPPKLSTLQMNETQNMLALSPMIANPCSIENSPLINIPPPQEIQLPAAPVPVMAVMQNHQQVSMQNQVQNQVQAQVQAQAQEQAQVQAQVQAQAQAHAHAQAQAQAQAQVYQAEANAIAAQVQHVQAAITHQHQQLAAAVVAQQVVAQMAVPIVGATPAVPQTSIPAVAQQVQQIVHSTKQAQQIPAAIHNAAIQAIHPAQIAPVVPIQPIEPQIQSAPIEHTVIPILSSPNMMLVNQLGQTKSDMVTVPKEMLLKLIQKSALRTMTCSCTCICGRYPAGSNIVEEVTKDLLNGGGSNAPCCDNQKEETKLETAEDMQRNGLLPSDECSVQWLNSTAATVDPTTIEEVKTRDNIFNKIITEPVAVDNEPREFTNEEKEKLEEINEVANRWINDSLNMFSLSDILSEGGLQLVVNGLKMLSAFRFLDRAEKTALVHKGLYSYCVVKWIQHHESISLEGINPKVTNQLKSLLEKDAGNFRVQPGIFNTFAVMVLFNANKDSETAINEKEELSKLLQKIISTNSQGRMEEYPQLFDILPLVCSTAEYIETFWGALRDEFVDSVV
ncbi:unnamed protein product [Caenorhabditis bovis]|uniref:Nuclear receptor domain-containing protein n=1 Tax=Caenorhabditis bovis TaxID=2654633 RepID=A0A8S1FE38_9PELO|nr:unnamed protein product [Caenorhabditis bovis]